MPTPVSPDNEYRIVSVHHNDHDFWCLISRGGHGCVVPADRRVAPATVFVAGVRRTRGILGLPLNEKPEMQRTIFDVEGHAFFVTFSCYRRRRLLDDNQAKSIVIHFLSTQLKNQEGNCIGFVVMPEHVHALVHFPAKDRLSTFMNQWKRRSSIALKHLYETTLSAYSEPIDLDGPMWQHKYYVFNVYSENKAVEKLHYMHSNPVKAGLAEKPVDWPYSSAGWYSLKRPVGVDIRGII